MPWALQNREKPGFFIPSHACFPGKLGKFILRQRRQGSVCNTVLQHFRVHCLFECHSLFGVLVSLSLSKLYTESQLEVREGIKYSVVVEYFKDESDGMGKIIDKYVSWYWRPQKWRPFVSKNFHYGKQKFLSSVVWRWKLKCMRIKSLT